MSQTIKYLVGVLLMLISSHLSLLADDFDPENPAEPNPPAKPEVVDPEVEVPIVYYDVKVTANPVGAVSSLSGAGRYTEGTKITLGSSVYSSAYKFSHWTKDGEWYSDQLRPTHIVEDTAVTFTVHYIYSPTSPEEPEEPEFPVIEEKHHLYFVAEPLNAGYFNLSSGGEFLYDQTITVRVTPNSKDYSFIGWYEGVKLVSTSQSFSFSMPGRDVRLTAKFEYDPQNPFEPSSPEDDPQDDVQTYPTGDANKDGALDVADAVRVINMLITGAPYDVRADADGDGKLDVADAVTIINACLKN